MAYFNSLIVMIYNIRNYAKICAHLILETLITPFLLKGADRCLICCTVCLHIA